MSSYEHTKPPLAQQRVRVLERRRLPLGLVEVIAQQPLRGHALFVPCRHAPQALQDGLLAQRQVEEAAVDGVLELALGVLVAGDDLELRFLYLYWKH